LDGPIDITINKRLVKDVLIGTELKRLKNLQAIAESSLQSEICPSFLF
jgi:hypothetical protein